MKAEILTFAEANAMPKAYFDNKVIIFPTDTIWGIACKLQDESAVKKIYEIKKRDIKKPLAVLCDSLETLQKLVLDAKSKEKINILGIKNKLDHLSLVVAKSELVPNFITSNLENVALRIPKYKSLQKFLKQNGPMPATSINESGEKPLNNKEEIINKYGNLVDVIIVDDSKNLSQNIASTVISLEGDKVEILREGIIKASLIGEALIK